MRKKRFMAALRLAGMSKADWAASRNRSLSHVDQVMRELRESSPLVAEMDAFITKTFSKHIPKDGAAA